MSAKSLRSIAIACLLMISASVRAEGNCPQGSYELPGPSKGVVNCAPLPSSDDPSVQREQGPRWQRRWGAIALDFGASNVGLGASASALSKSAAKREALADCRAKGGQDCRINLVYGNQCAVVIAATGYSRSHGNATVEIAAERGMKLCEAEGFGNCQIYYKACSLPVQVE